MGYFFLSKHGFTFVGGSLFLSLVSLAFSFYLFLFFLALTLFVSYFFRDPKRSVPKNDSLVLSSADGLVTSVEVVDSPLGDGSRPTRVAVFLNVFNVHVNRSPVTGVVKSVEYKAGLFLNTLNEESVTKNEMVRTVFETKFGKHTVVVEQLSGLIARRVVCDLEPGDEVKLGSRMGIIKFGSRFNVFLPPGVKPLVEKGNKVSAGETVLAYLDPNFEQNTPKFSYEKF